MARAKQTKGVCVFCGKESTRGGMSRHLQSCPERKSAIEAANQRVGKAIPIYHLVVRDAWGGAYWLHLEMKGTATLRDLDEYLRAIWLECCGHLSQFSVGGWGGDEIAMSRQIQSVFEPDITVTHIYDFGTSSETLISMVAVRQGRPMSRHPISLMARNAMPEMVCDECGAPASWLCQECIIEEDKPGLLCDACAQEHPHEDYGEPMPLVNSPRIGMCGYCGPADPPY
jgi:hypothetical protein